MQPTLLLTVESSFVLTGLGVLARGPAPALAPYARHTALAVALVWAGGRELTAVATVEEITQPSPTDPSLTLTAPALLLQLPEPAELPAGTEIWLTEQPLDDLFFL
ncbi:hypothetical protein E5K00_21285 [Hymenobacter aquaticus]|uniref:Uncharacterized protein n=1 Tax=Hymenobacter aquaticus TaxID=1867101 RepID=A0A4Z0PS23_9BACT|nr:hypothetical protein [Hymenobacter aquaticus]TGE20530.1 hypothetical protein E5K00_21285 [Hymenobacter aquaticus]